MYSVALNVYPIEESLQHKYTLRAQVMILSPPKIYTC